MKVAIVHDWLVGGGAELVVEQLHKMYPEAPIYTSYCTPEWRQRLDGKVVTGWLQHFGKLRKFLVLGRIWWFTHLDLSGYDLVISSSGNGEAFGVRVGKRANRPTSWPAVLGASEHRQGAVLDGTVSAEHSPQQRNVVSDRGPVHICYCHSPTHYYWRHYDQYLSHPGFGILDPLVRLGLKMLVGLLRRWDLKASQRPDYFIANSTHIKNDIKKYYGRDSVVIFPPVDTERFEKVLNSPRHGFVTMGRQVPYKKLDIIIEACNKLKLPLKVIGDGPEHDHLKKLAGPTIKFFAKADGNRISDEQMPAELASAEAFIFAAHEDFGIAPIEAMAAGTPVIAYQAGGALDYIIPNKTGEFFSQQTPRSLVEVLQNFDRQKYDAAHIKEFSEEFSIDSFCHKMHNFINSLQ